MKNTAEEFVDIIKQDFIRRCNSNENYSLRAFAKSIGIDQSYLSKIFRSERPLTLKMAYKAGSTLGLSANEVQKFFLEENDLDNNERQTHILNEDIFALTSDWFHFAILELLKVKNIAHNLESIASRLNLGKYEAELAIKRLERLAFIKIENDEIVLVQENNNWVNYKSTSEAKKSYQKQILVKALDAVDKVEFERRDQSSLTVAIKKNDYKLIIKKISKLRKEINKISNESINEADEVYQLVCSFYPLTITH